MNIIKPDADLESSITVGDNKDDNAASAPGGCEQRTQEGKEFLLLGMVTSPGSTEFDCG